MAVWKENYYEALVADIPGSKLRMVGTGFELDIRCEHGNHTVEGAYHGTGKPAPGQVRQHLRNKGWNMGRTAKKHRCPVHSRGQAHKPDTTPVPSIDTNEVLSMLKKSPELPKLAVQPPVEEAPVIVEVKAEDRSPAAKRAYREATAFVLDAIDESTNWYSDTNLDDAAVGKQFKLAPSAIEDIRLKHFDPPIVTPSEFLLLLEQLGALDKTIGQSRREFEESVRALVASHDEEMKRLRSEAATIRELFVSQAKESGWKLVEGVA